MPWFEATHQETVVVDADLEAARRHFADPAVIVAHTEGLERSSIEGDVVHFVLKLQDHGVFKFQGDYRCRYLAQDDGVRWDPVPGGNTEQSGEVKLTALPDGRTSVDYRETVKVDLPVPGMMAPMLKPVISAMAAQEIKGFLKRMVDSLPATTAS